MERTTRNGRVWVTNLTHVGDADMSVDRAVAEALSPEERIGRVWQLVLRQGRLIGVDYTQQRLQRSIAHVRRREG